jgi:hypothetical protein
MGIRARLSEHRSELLRGIHANAKLQHAVSHYGINAFDFIVIEFCDPAAARKREQYYLDTLEPWQHGFNALRKVTEYRQRSSEVLSMLAARASKVYKLEHDGVIYEGRNLAAFCRARGLHQGALTQVLLGKKPQFKGWTLPGNSVRAHRLKYWPTGEIVAIGYFGARPFARDRGLALSSIGRLIRGVDMVHKGWTLESADVTPEDLAFSLLPHAEVRRINGRKAALTLKGQPRRRRIDQLLRAR